MDMLGGVVNMDKQLDKYDKILMMLEYLEQRLSLLETAIGITEKNCKVCDTPIDIKNACREALLAELCDECWKNQSGDSPEDVVE